MKKQISPKIVSLTFSILVILFAIGFYIYAWTEPTTTPPGDNVDTPINVGDVTQYKSGALGVGGLFQTDDETHLAILDGNVGIGTTNPNSSKGTGGYLDAKDVYLRDTGKWASEGVGGEIRIWQNMGPRYTADSQDHTTSCDAGYLMSGLRIYATGALDGKMIAHCTKSSLSLSGSTTKTGPPTNADNQFHNVNCDNNQIIKEIKIRANTYLNGNIRLDCRNLVGASLDDSNPVWAYHRYHGANNDQYASDSNSVNNQDQIADCPEGYVAAGVRFYASGSLDSFDVLCKKIK